MEKWKDISGYKYHYQVNRSGDVRKIHNGKITLLKGGSFSNEYEFVSLTISDYNSKNCLRHRLVAEAFIPNPDNLPEVNHKNGNKKDNRVENLEWCNRSFNLAHALKIGLMESQCKIRRKCVVFNTLKPEVIFFDSMKDCCEFFGYKKGWLQNRLRKSGTPFVKYRNYLIEVRERR